MQRRVGILVSFALLLWHTAAVSEERPPCRIDRSASINETGNAGCLIADNGLTLLLVHTAGGKRGFPGGTAIDGETAQCTAHRETWEETGLDPAAVAAAIPDAVSAAPDADAAASRTAVAVSCAGGAADGSELDR